jgi:hypothetical protein
MNRNSDRWRILFVCALIMLVAALLERSMGRLWISKSGHIQFWVGQVASAENSQQIADWYSFTHIIHGFLFYAIFYLVSRGRWSIGSRLILAMLAESTWEVIENTPYIIHYYRTATISLGYTGDTVLNSMSDILFMLLGFAIAQRIPVWLATTLAIVMEVGLAIVIRDNLTLNILMFIHPFECIKHWQAGKG